MFLEYIYIVYFFIISVILALIIFFLSYFLIPKTITFDKLSAYECGFDPFGDARTKFDVRFYLVALLFIIFDLEITFLFPWSVSLRYVGAFGFWLMWFFLFVLTIGFMYEWQKGALEWE